MKTVKWKIMENLVSENTCLQPKVKENNLKRAKWKMMENIVAETLFATKSKRKQF